MGGRPRTVYVPSAPAAASTPEGQAAARAAAYIPPAMQAAPGVSAAGSQAARGASAMAAGLGLGATTLTSGGGLQQSNNTGGRGKALLGS